MRRPTFLAAGIVIVITCGALHPARAQDADKSLGATLEGLLAVSRQLSPGLRAAALDTAAASGKGRGRGRPRRSDAERQLPVLPEPERL